MRRKFNNTKFISYILLIAVFTVFSYFFDQMVIRKEDDLRNLKIKLDNLTVKINNINNVTNQLTTTQQFSGLRYLSMAKFRNYWFKNLIILEEDIILKKDKEDLLNSFIDNEFGVLIIKTRFLDFYISTIQAHNSIREKLFDIYAWQPKDLFPEYWDKDGFVSYPDVEFDLVFNEIKDIYEKNFTKYAAIVYDDQKYQYALSNFNINDWSDLYKYTYNLINKFDFYYDFINDDLEKLEKKLEKKEIIRDNVIIKITKTNSLKNYFILTSIVSQIISLLFLLFLFRSLLLINRI